MPEAPQSRHKIDLSSADFREAKRDLDLELRAEATSEDKRTVEFSFASESPVDRWFGREILDITKEACDLTRLNGGGACLMDHDWRDQVGVVTKAWIDPATKKARCEVKFSRSARGKEVFDDIKDGIRRLVSVGYVVRKMVLQSVDGDVETHRVTEWQPFEVSLVAVPADPSVGVGRNAALTAQPPETHGSETPNSKHQTPNSSTRGPAALTRMSATVTEPEKPAATHTDPVAAERTRIKDLNAAAKVLSERHPAKAEAFRLLAAKCAETGDGMASFHATVCNDILATERTLAPVVQDPNAATLGLSKRDIKRYPLLEAIRSRLENKPLPAQVRECSDAIAKQLDRAPNGFFIPDDIVNDRRTAQRTLLAGTPADGGYTISQDLLASEFVTFLRNQARVMGLGARTISGLRGDISIPRQLTGASAYWVSETGTITSSSATFGQIVGKPRRIGTSVPYSKQFLAQTSLDADSFVINDSDEAIAVELDRIAINGSGNSEPLGILNLASGDLAGTVAFSAAPTWAKYLAFFQTLAEAKTLGLGTPAYLTTPASAVKAMTVPKFSNTATPIWDNDRVGTFAAQWSNQFPSGDKVIFGAFSEVVYLEWAGRDVIVDPYGSNATGATVTVTIQRMLDMVIRRAKSFVRSTDSGAQ